jgi:signal transduction histidine kinase
MRPEVERERQDHALRLMHIASSIAAQHDLDPLLQEIVDAAAELIGAEFGGILVLDQDDRAHYELLRVHGWSTPESLPQPQGRGILGLPHREGRPLRLGQVEQHPASVGVPSGHPAIGPFLGVPLRFRDRVLGSLFLGQRPGHQTFTADDEVLLIGLANLAAVAIENAHLHVQTQQFARIQERERLAHDLHDTVAQLFYSIGVEAESGLDACRTDHPPLDHLEAIHRLATQGSVEVRRAIFALTRSVQEEGLGYILRTLVEEFEANTGIETCLVLPPDLVLPTARACDAVMRIVQEALANVRKHARATMVLVNVSAGSETLTVTVQDNGIGISPQDLRQAMDENGHQAGIVTLRTMVERLGGRLSLVNGEEEGLVLKAQLPLPCQDGEGA